VRPLNCGEQVDLFAVEKPRPRIASGGELRALGAPVPARPQGRPRA
jgi:hypothetical protein